MDSMGLKRKDTTKGPPLRILSLDGGGVRGYSMFIIIQEIMHRTFVEIEGRAPKRHEIPKPADHFDLIVGTGTGGLIALMLGRLRLDLETCKELYVRLTRVVFETDKTLLGIPTRHTLFKATKLEDAIKEAVRDHTADEDEGNDGTEHLVSPLAGGRPPSSIGRALSARRHMSNGSVVSFSARSPTSQMAHPVWSSSKNGDPNARLYDSRVNRTKTAVTAIYKGAPKDTPPVMLRSYDSRKEPSSEYDCKIWEAGRATCSIGLAFKPITIGQSVFHDDGEGRFNPSPEALDEATVNEWPGREVGVFVSIGTGKRPKGSDGNHAQWYDGFLGEFAEARKRLISKIEGCEKTHEYMVREHLSRRGVNIENYYRFNVEVGVGEFGMNEWHRLAEISTNTRLYLSREREQHNVHGASLKMAKIHRAKQRFDRISDIPELVKTSPEISQPLAVELPADIPTTWPTTPSSRHSYESGGMEGLSVASGNTPSPRNSSERFPVGSQAPPQSHGSPRHPPPPTGAPPAPPGSSSSTAASSAPTGPTSAPAPPVERSPHGAGKRSSAPPGPRAGMSSPSAPSTSDDDRLVVMAPTPSQYRAATTNEERARRQSEQATFSTVGGNRMPGSYPQQQLPPHSHHYRIEPPPLPPKTPIPEGGVIQGGFGPVHRRNPADSSGAAGLAPSSLPYPTDDEPPPAVNMARKPDYHGR